MVDDREYCVTKRDTYRVAPVHSVVGRRRTAVIETAPSQNNRPIRYPTLISFAIDPQWIVIRSS